jgi:methyl-accepting chemotaxis protein
MTAIKLALNLTYHYTFNLLYNDEENNCFYIIDVNEGSEYTPIGSYDVMDADDLLGAENVILRDKTYVSEIKLWEKWGLLKVAYAGIKDSNSNVVAVTGTDVDISIINTKTKNALIQSIIIGILALIIGIFASYYVAIKMINPIQKLKYSALKIAAGNYGDNIFIKSPKELNALSVEFNYMSNELKTTLENFSDYSSSVQAEGVSKELQKRLYQLSCIDDERIKIEGLKESTNVVGIVKKYDIYYVYALDETYDTIVDASQKRVVINDLLKRFLESSSEVEFIDIVKPSEFIILDMNSLVFEDILNKKVIQTNNEFHELVVLDITIKICTDDKGAV